MTVYTVDSTKVGTSLVAVPGTITAMTMAAVPPITTDPNIPVLLTDGVGGRTLWGATLGMFAYLWEPRPGVALTPGTTAPTFPKSVNTGSLAFSKGLYVQSCPPGYSVAVTA